MPVCLKKLRVGSDQFLGLNNRPSPPSKQLRPTRALRLGNLGQTLNQIIIKLNQNLPTSHTHMVKPYGYAAATYHDGQRNHLPGETAGRPVPPP